MPDPVSRGPAIVNDAAQRLEKGGRPMDFVDDSELSGLCPQVGIGVVQPAQVGRAFEVEVDSPGLSATGDAAGEGSLPDLPGSEEDHRWHVPEPVFD